MLNIVHHQGNTTTVRQHLTLTSVDVKRQTIPSIGEDVKKLHLCCCWKYKNAIATLGIILVVSLKVKHLFTRWPSNPTPRYFTQEEWRHISTRRSVPERFSDVIHNTQKVEIIQVPSDFFLWLTSVLSYGYPTFHLDKLCSYSEKQNVAYPLDITIWQYGRTTDTCHIMDELQKHHPKWKKGDTKDHSIVWFHFHEKLWRGTSVRQRLVVA